LFNQRFRVIAPWPWGRIITIIKLDNMRRSIPLAIAASAVLLVACQPAPPAENLLRYVDPFIGTAAHGHVYPGATVPFGAVQLSPDNGTQGWDWCSGYNYIDDTIAGFSHTHLSGTGIGDLCDISMMPTLAPVDFNVPVDDYKTAPYAAKFSHDNETASPGYYRVELDQGIKVELTAARHAGVQRYTFPAGVQKYVLLDLGFAINWDKPTATAIRMQETLQSFTGHRYSTGWAMRRCPFLEVARDHQDVVCAVHLGLVRGALSELGVDVQARDLIPWAEPDACITHLSVPSSQPA
jgi:putative alpha-1,2-mannosidase